MFSMGACSDSFPVEHMGTTHKLSSTALWPNPSQREDATALLWATSHGPWGRLYTTESMPIDLVESRVCPIEGHWKLHWLHSHVQYVFISSMHQELSYKTAATVLLPCQIYRQAWKKDSCCSHVPWVSIQQKLLSYPCFFENKASGHEQKSCVSMVQVNIY